MNKKLYLPPVGKQYIYAIDCSNKIKIELLKQQKSSDIVRVGVSAIIRKGNDVLLGQRKMSHGTGCWCTPGGHIEFGETPEDAIRREIVEETGLKLGKVTRSETLPYLNSFFKEENKQYITLYFESEYVGGEPIAMEPEKCDTWLWFFKYNLPEPLFTDMQSALLGKC